MARSAHQVDEKTFRTLRRGVPFLASPLGFQLEPLGRVLPPTRTRRFSGSRLGRRMSGPIVVPVASDHARSLSRQQGNA